MSGAVLSVVSVFFCLYKAGFDPIYLKINPTKLLYFLFVFIVGFADKF
jgi:hypothetical protein